MPKWERIHFFAKDIIERAELIADKTKSEEKKFNKRLLKDWLFEIEGLIEEIREEVKD